MVKLNGVTYGLSSVMTTNIVSLMVGALLPPKIVLPGCIVLPLLSLRSVNGVKVVFNCEIHAMNLAVPAVVLVLYLLSYPTFFPGVSHSKWTVRPGAERAVVLVETAALESLSAPLGLLIIVKAGKFWNSICGFSAGQ